VVKILRRRIRKEEGNEMKKKIIIKDK